ncbi:uncharacterized protein LOC131008314 [Salvia miltiorrhiza]|uniref:uncharacterized protein LOC131008314 n=1 Tax=Salvia miltiorrhiza TaxID=226208 RepID=UPI0025AC6FD8|nr:uncharacterized protein LOC131008314 [Salvia miltiorrhiza]
MVEWFDDTSSSSSDKVAQEIMDIVENKKVVAQYFSQSKLTRRVISNRSYVYRDHEAAHLRLMQDYFNDIPTYAPTFFWRHFRMHKQLFLCIVDAVQGVNATGVSADIFDKYLKIVDTTGRLCLKKFCKAVIREYGAEYLRHPTFRCTRRDMDFP